MIERITVAGVATYPKEPQFLDELKEVNFVFGGNASGKTTLARVIADETFGRPDCAVAWMNGAQLRADVFCSDFVDKNFGDSKLRGIFTLGEKSKDTLQKIAALKLAIDQLTHDIAGLSGTLEGSDGAGGKIGELKQLEDWLTERCWEQKLKHDDALSGAFEGYRNNKQKFKDKVLLEKSRNSATLQQLADLVGRAKTVFGKAPSAEPEPAQLDFSKLLAFEADPLLSKKILGRTDVDIAAMIQALNNSDWVRQGLPFFEANKKKFCPFCQQTTREALAKSFSDYFDVTFETDSQALKALEANYMTEVQRARESMEQILAASSRFLDVEKLRSERTILEAKLGANLLKLAAKRKEPSRSVELESIASASGAAVALVDLAIKATREHNRVVANLARERAELTSQVWRYLLDNELKKDLSDYETKKVALEKAIVGLETKVAEKGLAKKSAEQEIAALEKLITSIQPTVDRINAILRAFGFTAFSIAPTGDGVHYQLIRADGADARKTLSEGERNFVSFLYFYSLLRGSHSEAGITADRVVVIDDPVSSLDSNVLFIVSSLIKELIEEARAGDQGIKQVFVLTHNVYFHREVTFRPKRFADEAGAKTSYWVIGRSESESRLVKHKSNPIVTSYQLLWLEARRPDPSKLTIQNTLRRILEAYFKILGDVDPDEICAKFQGQERLIAKSLFYWMNAGSHLDGDDLYFADDTVSIDQYRAVFREIFVKTRHIEHYNMMMKLVPELAEGTAVDPDAGDSGLSA